MKTFAASRTAVRYFLHGGIGWLAFAVLLSACSDQVEITRRYTYLMPVYTTADEIRNSFEIEPSRPLTATGKIYYRAPYLFINQPGEGVHVINNTDPSRPINERFIRIPGNYDMAVQDNILYADSYVDLLAIDISDVSNVAITKRVENAFPRYNSWGYYPDSVMGIVTRWEEQEVAEVLEDEMTSFSPGIFHYRGGVVMNDVAFANVSARSEGGSSSIAPVATPGAGVGGSMARFAIAGLRLYAVDDYNLQVFSLASPEDPVAGPEFPVGFNIETIFPFRDKLFIGSQEGMFIYDRSDPDNPTLLSEFSHARSCDPVVANDSIAYVTLRSGTACQGFTNQLDVIDIRDVTTPRLIESFLMDNPHGLGISGTTLFICEGEFGLKVFDATDSRTIDEHRLAHFKDIHAYDVIPLPDVLIMIGEDGLYQYDYTDPANIKPLSKLTITRPDSDNR